LSTYAISISENYNISFAGQALEEPTVQSFDRPLDRDIWCRRDIFPIHNAKLIWTQLIWL